jgi:hypothetical protein
MTDIFDRVPDTLFLPLVGPNRQTYSKLLLELYPLFFEQLHTEVFPSRETVRAEMDELLARMAVFELTHEDEFVEGTEVVVDEGSLASRAYRRLRNTGWLEEEHEGYRARVSVNPSVATIWSALIEIAKPEKVF